ncbi:uncharacterized protein TNCV_1359371 [Trichonephila clavipes]|nr:uncharacterized protein TNCV_1359371 [Trichonephila clavipes]
MVQFCLDKESLCIIKVVELESGYTTNRNCLMLHPSPVAVVAEWSRYWIVAGFVTSSSPVSLKTHRVKERCMLNLSRIQTSSRWCGVVVRRGCQLRCPPRLMIMAQNYVVRRQKPSSSSTVRR